MSEKYVVNFACQETAEGREYHEILDTADVSLAVGKHELLEIVIQDRQGRHKRILITALVQQYQVGGCGYEQRNRTDNEARPGGDVV